MGLQLYRLRNHLQTTAALKETGGDKDGLITITVPTPRTISQTMIVGGILFDTTETQWDYQQEIIPRALPPEKEIERARAESRYENPKGSFYSRFYNDNQPNPRIRTTGGCTYLSFDRVDPEIDGGSKSVTIHATPEQLQQEREQARARHDARREWEQEKRRIRRA